MSCQNCESTNLVADETTGQLICSECGTATGTYQGATEVGFHRLISKL